MAQFPAEPRANSLSLISLFPSEYALAQDGGRYIRVRDAHVWMFELGYERLSDDEFSPIQGFIQRYYGKFGTFTYIPPDLETPRGTALGTPLVSGAGQVGTSLDIQDCDADQQFFLRAGDVFSVAGSLKVYMLIVDASSDVNGDCRLYFRPALETSPLDLAALSVTSVEFTVGLDDNEQSNGIGIPLLFGKKFKLLERSI